MEIFLLVIILIFLLWIQSKLAFNKDELHNLHNELLALKTEIIRLSGLLITQQKDVSMSPEAEIKPAETKRESPPAAEVIPVLPIDKRFKLPIPQAQSIKMEDIAPKVQESVPYKKQTDQYKPQFAENKPSWFQQWLKDNPDIEKFIGENLINKIGIAILVLGISFFVKYAIDQDWINKVGRVCIGLISGGILIVLAHRLRKNYHSFSSVLVGGGLSVFYFTIAYAFHQYHLISQDAAFAIMVLITVFAVILSVLYDRIELGIIAAVGGFITPFLVSTGEGNYIVLFTYLSILNIGLIVLAYYKRWRVLNFLAFFFTELIYISWIVQKVGDPGFPYMGTFIFGSVFYLMFIVMNVIHHVIRNSRLLAFDFIILLSVNLFYFVTGLYLLQQGGNDTYRGLFTASLGIINLILAYFFFKKSKADKNFIFLLIGITVTFISLCAPVQLKGHHITLFWSAELVVLFWLYQKSFIRLIKLSSLLVTALMMVSLFMDWVQVYGDMATIHPIVLNKGFITGICAATSLLLYFLMMRSEADTYFLGGLTNNLVRRIYFLAAIILIFSTGALEIVDQFSKRMPGTGLENVYLSLYVVIIAIILFNRIQYREPKILPWITLIIPALALVYYLFNLQQLYESELYLLEKNVHRNYFVANWITFVLFLVLIYNCIQFFRKNKHLFDRNLTASTVIISLAGITILSFELMHLFIWLSYSDPSSIVTSERIYSKAGLSVIWGITSFFIMWLGMKNSYKPLRIIALVIFGITLVKLFVYDIIQVTPGGKILAFILLGVLLLIVSFMYQRLKKIIIDDVEKSN